MKNKDLIFLFSRKLLILFHRDANDQAVKALGQFIKFCLVGATNTMLSYVLNLITLLFLKPFTIPFDYVIANVVAFLLSVAWSFFWNSRFVFQTSAFPKKTKWKMLLKTYVSYAFTGLIMNNFLSWLWIEKLFVSKYLAPLLNLIFSIPLNFLMNKFWAFRN